MFETIIVGVDGDEGGRDALALAAALQWTFDSRLIAVMAYPADEFINRATSPPFESAIRDESRQMLATELERAAVEAEPFVVPDGSPARALQRAAERYDAGLIVIGSDRQAHIGRVLAGDVTSGTLHCACCPVAVVPRGLAESWPQLRTIAVGLDGSPESRAAAALARDLAEATGAGLRLLCVVPPAVPAGSPWASTAVAIVERDRAARQQARTLVDDAAAEIGDQAMGDSAPGIPHEELARLSHGVDLVVVGSRSYGPLRRLLLGSTSTKLVHEAACPVLVLPRSAEEPSAAMVGATATETDA
jgi:nucleotide-binding universal stress UspA family protein